MLSMLTSIVFSGALVAELGTTTQQETQCSTLSGTYSFLGKSLGRPGAQSASGLRFDEKAMGMTVRTVVDPHTVMLNHDGMSGDLSAEITGTGIDQRFVGMSAKLPLTATFACKDGSWVREKTMEGNGGGGRPSVTNVRISLRSTPSGLLAEGAITRTTGTFSRQTITQEWQVLFIKK
jgi:hypothetical protein